MTWPNIAGVIFVFLTATATITSNSACSEENGTCNDVPNVQLLQRDFSVKLEVDKALTNATQSDAHAQQKADTITKQTMDALQSNIRMLREAIEGESEDPTMTVADAKELSSKIDEMAKELSGFLDSLESSLPATHQNEGDKPENELIRHWSICLGDRFKPAASGDASDGIMTGNDMECTDQFIFQDLCCLDFSTLEFNNQVTVTLADPPTAEDTTEAAAAVLDDTGVQPAEVQIGVLCTQKRLLKTKGGDSTAHMPEDCYKQELSMAEATDPTVILGHRIQYLMDQGLTAESIPTCKKAIPTCPEGTVLAGGEPNSASDAMLATLAGTSSNE